MNTKMDGITELQYKNEHNLDSEVQVISHTSALFSSKCFLFPFNYLSHFRLFKCLQDLKANVWNSFIVVY